MPLSTFNSRGRVLAGASIAMVVLLALYQALVLCHLIPPSDGIMLSEDNQIRTQRYGLISDAEIGPVLVGSSLTANIKSEYVGKEVTNLGLYAGAATTGLEIVARSRPRPSLVVIEAQGEIVQPLDTGVVTDATEPTLQRTRQIFPILRREYQPISVLMSLVKKICNGHLNEDHLGHAAGLDPSLRNQALVTRIDANQKPLTSAEVAQFASATDAIKRQIARLHQRGIPVVFQRVPFDTSLMQTPRQRQIQALLHKEFPDRDYPWIPEPGQRQWATADTSHLSLHDAKLYGAYLGQWLQSKNAVQSRRLQKD